jgi:hypothetical protein
VKFVVARRGNRPEAAYLDEVTMESSGFPIRILILVVLGVLIVSFLVIRARRRDREVPTDEVARTRLIRVYLCFLLMNVLGAVVGASMKLIHVRPESREGAGMLGGMILAVTVWIALPVAAYNSLFVWRRRSVQVLWLLVALLISAFAMLDVLPDMMVFIIVPVYFLATSALVVRGLATLRQAPPT